MTTKPAQNNQEYRLGILGYPLSHSLSPIMHQHFLKLAGLTGQYETIEIISDKLSGWFEQGTHQQFSGLNITIPHKTQLFPHLNMATPVAQLTGAVNTMYRDKNNLWVGENTDAEGFEESIPKDIMDKLPGATVLVLGAGGACRSVAYSLIKNHVSQITLKVRPTSFYQPALRVMETMKQALGATTRLSVCNNWDNPALRPEKCLLVVNTTPIGTATMDGIENEVAIPPDVLKKFGQRTLIMDLVYNPEETPLIQAAKQFKLKTENGLPMLVYQGAKAFEYWTGTQLTSKQIQETITLLRDHLKNNASQQNGKLVTA